VVTTAMHDLSEGDTMGVRGPLGNSFPLDELKGKNLVIIAAGSRSPRFAPRSGTC